jgi:hypothetical protein
MKILFRRVLRAVLVGLLAQAIIHAILRMIG